jgi:hypothetical protein
MGLTQKLGTIPLAILTDASNNIGIGAAPSGSYKLEVTGTGRFTSSLTSDTLLVNAAAQANVTALIQGKVATAGTALKVISDGNGTDKVFEFTGADGVAAQTMTMLQSGNVGIGISTGFNVISGTETTLQIAGGNVASLYLNSTGSNKWALFANASGSLGVYNLTASTIPFQIASTGAATFSTSITIGTSGYAGNELQMGNGSTDFAIDLAGSGKTDIYSTSILAFHTALTERMRITSGGDVLIAKTVANIATKGAQFGGGANNAITENSDAVLYINRLTNDGELIVFRQDNVTEGNISVSGSTVSYNGGHLSRYSQTELNEKIEGLLKGTVMSNLDKMAEWINPETKEPYENEQLNCMKISDVEGDKNVAGVFVNWEYDSELLTNDMNIAMTGDMIIRIAQGVVVEKGDLLISAGGGTAKPQSDDLIRSNTIAKVTSNHITCVYEDGSYCVPCVLMAC